MGIIQLKFGTGSASPSSLQDGEFAINVDTNQLWYGSGSSPVSKLRLDELTAENYVVSSSVTSYTFQSFSGSTDFGDDSGDIHKRTGSLNISGALNLNGPVNAITVTGNINANGNIVGDGSTNITNVDTISGDGTITMSDVTIDGTLNNGVPILAFTSSQYSPVGGIAYAGGTDAGNRYALMFAGLNENLVSLCNRQHNGRVDIRANTSTAGESGEVTASLFTHNSVQLLLPVTASSDISASGTIKSNGFESTATYHAGAIRVIYNLNDTVFLGDTAENQKVSIQASNITLNAPVTASGNISSSGTVTANTLRLSSTTDASATSTGHAFQAGATNSTNVIMDNNEIMARNNGAVADLHVNPDGGNITFNNSVSDKVIIGNGHVTASGNISASGDIFCDDLTVDDQLDIGDDIRMSSPNAGIFFDATGEEYTFGIGQGGLVMNAGTTNPASVSHFMVSASGGTANANARVAIGGTPDDTNMLTVYGNISASGEIKANTLDIASTSNFADDITLGDTKKLKGVRIVISGSQNNNIYGATTFNDIISGDTTLQGNLRIGGSGDTSNNWISIDCQNGNDSSGGGITFYETGTYDVDSPQYGAKIVYNEDDDEFAIGTMDNNTFKRQIWMKRNLDYVYLADAVFAEGTTPGFILSDTSTTVADGDNIGSIGWRNEDDDSYTLNIKGIATEDHASNSAGGSKLEFYVTPNTTSDVALAATINHDKTLNVSGSISSDNTILAGWHGSTTRIKILVSDFIPDDIGRPAMIDDTGSDRWLESHGTGVLFASIPIPTGFKATHVHIYGSATSAVTVYEADINSKTVTSKGTGNIGTEIDITDVTSNTTNYLFLELAQASGEEVYGGYVTIAAI